MNRMTSLGMNVRLERVLAYAFGWVSGLLLFFLEKNRNVRWHAAQSMVTFGTFSILMFAVSLLKGFLAWIPLIGWLTSAGLGLLLTRALVGFDHFVGLADGDGFCERGLSVADRQWLGSQLGLSILPVCTCRASSLPTAVRRKYGQDGSIVPVLADVLRSRRTLKALAMLGTLSAVPTTLKWQFTLLAQVPCVHARDDFWVAHFLKKGFIVVE